MHMKKRIEIFIARLQEAVKGNPMEVFLSILFFIIGCYHHNYKGQNTEMALLYFPVIFLFTYILNQLTWQKRRWLYYLSALSFLPFLFIDISRHYPTYLVSLIAIQLAYLAGCWKKDNNAFMQIGIHYIGALLSAAVLASIAWLLSLSIYYSISYIFEIWEGHEYDYISYSSCFFYLGIMPLLFLMFNQRKENVNYAGNKTFNVLMNYVLSPALLIYAVILYLYFIKITVLWSLPKGAVAYIVVSFTSATFMLKGCQEFLEKRHYEWFYRHASLAVFPALIMYWVGSLYRINEYGYTEPRVYLVVTGLILTGTAIMFIFKRTAHYLYIACLAVILLSSVTYIPGITASDIERISQSARGNTQSKEKYVYPSYVDLNNNNAIEIKDYKTIQLVGTDMTDGIWTDQAYDTFYVYQGNKNLLFKEQIDTFLLHQMYKIGLTATDTIPDSANSKIFELDLDSIKLVIGRISLTRDSIYHVSYIDPAYYLQR